jgi:hypothetical protein
VVLTISLFSAHFEMASRASSERVRPHDMPRHFRFDFLKLDRARPLIKDLES